MSEPKHLILNWIHAVGIIVSILAVFAGICIWGGMINTKVEGLEKKTSDQTIAINNLTRAINCHVTGGSAQECIVVSSLSYK
jgi:hypothetical protein